MTSMVKQSSPKDSGRKYRQEMDGYMMMMDQQSPSMMSMTEMGGTAGTRSVHFSPPEYTTPMALMHLSPSMMSMTENGGGTTGKMGIRSVHFSPE